MRGACGAARITWLLAVLLAGWSAAVSGQMLSDAALTEALQRGGNVIYLRHTDTGAAYPEPPTVDLARCETQRNLNDKGRAEAGHIGEQFRRLRIPVGAVLSSEFCRCRDTAQLAFGRYQTVPALTGVARAPEFEDARRRASEGLRTLLSTPPPAGKNTVLVSHGFNLIDLEGLYLSTQGEAAVYRPDTRGGYSLLARVLPTQWSRLPAGR
jgi:broad specificity phosphatase PhoE